MPEGPQTSQINHLLFGDTTKYEKVMVGEAKKLARTYPDKDLNQIFTTLSQHGLTLGPMSACDTLAKDLGINVGSDILAAIGLSCLLISTHDDVVDEMPKSRQQVSQLLFAGNIALLEGMRILFKKGNLQLAEIIINAVNQNHYLQHRGVGILWTGKEISKKTYLSAIRHTGILASIGPLSAICIARKMNLEKRVSAFSMSYGIALQILDDLRELEEDKLSGYISLPLVEGPPFTNSFEELFRNINIARMSLNKNWKRTQEFVDRIERIAESLRKEI